MDILYRIICKVQVRSLGIFEHTERGEPHGLLGLGVLLTIHVGLGF